CAARIIKIRRPRSEREKMRANFLYVEHVGILSCDNFACPAPPQATRAGWPYYTRLQSPTRIVGPPLAGGLPGFS
ncbi:MAG TPA: hypothetical protein VFQ30_17335, partial [Ktedonobacteraceae bacterium]|nr:hypothetical protein [Ktedonobacteraceae bacterium]